ncbi:beta-ureidopropionase [Procambarus clarkii]|uniref:beta-ureidopropionase n=1 Tax=Procambarus clarkii TaxID=6728 RepID=UPI001E66FEAF
MAAEFEHFDKFLDDHIPEKELKVVKKLLYGREHPPLAIPEKAEQLAQKHNFEIKGFQISAAPEELTPPRIVRVCVLQNSIVLETSAPVAAQRAAIHEKITHMIDAAALCGVNVLCFQEAWYMPYAFCTREKKPWCEFAECPETGPTAQLIQELARKYDMVIVNPIIERDHVHGDRLWNTAVVFSNTGNYLGKSRKNHMPRAGNFNESTYFMEGDTGHVVFQTKYGRIAVNICYGRHHPQNWMMFGLNGAEIVFNPAATLGGLGEPESSFNSEPLWGIEARSAAVANSYFTCPINRVGTEIFPNEFTSGDGRPGHKDLGYFYGSSYVAAPDGSRTPSLSRTRDGILISEIDLNLCRQMKDRWGFRMTQRLEMYSASLSAAIQPDYQPPIIRDTC